MKALLSEIAERKSNLNILFIAVSDQASAKRSDDRRHRNEPHRRMRLIANSMWRRRSCAAVELPDRDAELFGLVGEVRGDAGAWKYDDPDRHHGEYLVVAPERCGLGVAGPVGLEGDLRDLAGVGPGGGDALGAPRAAAVEQYHAGMLGVNLVEPVPDGAMVVEVETAREGDLGTGRQQHLGLGAAPGGEEVAAVDHCGREGAVVDHRPGARAPG